MARGAIEDMLSQAAAAAAVTTIDSADLAGSTAHHLRPGHHWTSADGQLVVARPRRLLRLLRLPNGSSTKGVDRRGECTSSKWNHRVVALLLRWQYAGSKYEAPDVLLRAFYVSPAVILFRQVRGFSGGR